MREKLFLFMLMVVIGSAGHSQELLQTLRGRVIDAETQVPLPGATVIIVGSDPLQGTATDVDGYFRLDGVKIGRYTLKAAFMGYDPSYLHDIQITSGRQSVIDIGLKPSILMVEGVEIKAGGPAAGPLNTMATLSARQINMEEANRYAGGFDDPSRLATSFAGVAGNLSSNGIAIRGNSPRGMLWQLEGVPVSNPNHFSDLTTFGGGGITALSSQVIAGSDFFTGAFPAEYGNALSGVFDLRMRQGNHEKAEHTLKVGTVGLDYASEGPFRRGKTASYLFNYRYSTLALLAPLLPENGGSVRYQDLSFKTFSRLGKAGTLSFWGLGSYDRSGSKAEPDSSLWVYADDRQRATAITSMGAAGATYKHVISPSSLLSVTANIASNRVNYEADWLTPDQQYLSAERVDYQTWSLNFSAWLTRRFSRTHSNKSGFSYRQLYYDIGLGHAAYQQAFASSVNSSGDRGLINAWSQSKVELPGNLSLNAGLHAVYFRLNEYLGLEPRLGLSWKFAPAQRLSLAWGLHSQMEMLAVYLQESTAHGQVSRPNGTLPFTKAHHVVLAWDKQVNEFTRLKAEAYYQYLFQVPVIPGTSFSMINLDRDWYLDAAFKPEGKGQNLGVDVTLEKFMNKGYYYLVTATLFDSRYRDGQDIWRDTRYNRKWILNLLGGKEWKCGRRQNNLLGVNARFNLMGGDRMTPPDQQASRLAGEVVPDEALAFTVAKPAVYYLDFTLNYIRNRTGHASTWSIQLINLLAREECNGYRFNLKTGQAERFNELTMVPNISYKIEF